MENDEKKDFIFDIIYQVLKDNDNWIKYQDLINQAMEKIAIYPLIKITKLDLIKFLDDCIDADYMAVAKKDYKNNVIKDSDYVCGYWVGLNKNDD